MRIASLLLVAACSAVAGGQVQVVHPSELAPTDPCGAVPFGCLPPIPTGQGYSFVQAVPAARMDAAHREVREIAFAPCVSGGTFGTLSVTIGLGHVPSPLPDPFVFPAPDGSSLGSFLDLRVLWYDGRDGGFSWTVAQDVWSPMGFAARGGTQFVWNGADDVGFLISHNLSSTAPQGLFGGQFHGEPVGGARSADWGAPASTVVPVDLKIRLTCVPAVPRFDFSLSSSGAGDLSLSVAGLPAGVTEGWTFPSATWFLPPGNGLVAGIEPDQLTLDVLTGFPVPLPGNPLHWTDAGPLVFPHAPFVLPPGSTAPLAGLTWDWVSLALGPGLQVVARSDVVRFTF